MYNATFEVSLPKSATISELKENCTTPSSINHLEQNLVYRGRILVNEKILSDYNIANEHTIILVKKYTESKCKSNKNLFISFNLLFLKI
jgi:uncharacterized ubiquitin-like protein YukD